MATAALALGAALSGTSAPAAAQATPEKVRVGYAVSMTGPMAGAALATTTANYRLWAKNVNAKGGIMVETLGRRLPLEVTEYDDTSNPETAIRLTERLMTEAKVDFVLPPWGTAMNLAVAPIYKRHNYPHLAGSAVVNDRAKYVQRFNTMFFMMDDASNYATGLVDLLTELKDKGKINDKVAALSVADQFGADLNAAAQVAFAKSGFQVVVGKTYPRTTTDLSGDMRQAKDSGADTFAGFSYPPDTIMIVAQAQTLGYAPKLFYTAVGTAFPTFRDRFGQSIEGVIGLGGFDSSTPAARAYLAGYKELNGIESDRWGSPAAYASLEILEQAIGKSGLDRARVTETMRTGRFDTVLGQISFKGQLILGQPLVSQWQKSDYVSIIPGNSDKLIFPKPAW